ncbi:MAG TPA: Uma2 family endonuclease [Thermomicrobiales bacterium]
MSTTTRLYSIDDLMAMPTDQPWELWEGELQKVPGAGGEASDIAGEILVHIRLHVKPRKLGIATGADGTYILAHDPPTVVVPDVAFVRWERLPGRVRPDGYIPVAPDLAVEVRSPTDRSGDINAKLERYRHAGVPLVWWVDPKRRAVRVYRHGELAAELGDGDVLDGEDILPGFTLPVSEIFE